MAKKEATTENASEKNTASSKSVDTKEDQNTQDESSTQIEDKQLTAEQQKKAEQKSQSEEDVKAKAAADSAKSKAKTGSAVYISRHRNLLARSHKFTNGRFETSDPKVIAELEAHPAFGTRFIRDDSAA